MMNAMFLFISESKRDSTNLYLYRIVAQIESTRRDFIHLIPLAPAVQMISKLSSRTAACQGIVASQIAMKVNGVRQG